jgi:hypothetical protein
MSRSTGQGVSAVLSAPASTGDGHCARRRSNHCLVAPGLETGLISCRVGYPAAAGLCTMNEKRL